MIWARRFTRAGRTIYGKVDGAMRDLTWRDAWGVLVDTPWGRLYVPIFFWRAP